MRILGVLAKGLTIHSISGDPLLDTPEWTILALTCVEAGDRECDVELLATRLGKSQSNGLGRVSSQERRNAPPRISHCAILPFSHLSEFPCQQEKVIQSLLTELSRRLQQNFENVTLAPTRATTAVFSRLTLIDHLHTTHLSSSPNSLRQLFRSLLRVYSEKSLRKQLELARGTKHV